MKTLVTLLLVSSFSLWAAEPETYLCKDNKDEIAFELNNTDSGDYTISYLVFNGEAYGSEQLLVEKAQRVSIPNGPRNHNQYIIKILTPDFTHQMAFYQPNGNEPYFLGVKKSDDFFLICEKH